MRLLITGAAGMLGRDLTAAARAAGHEVIAYDLAELDLTDPQAVATKVPALAPDAIVNCAAYTNVDQAESDPDPAGAVNATAPGLLAAAAAQCGAWIVHVSTDYVFAGDKTTGPYLESDPTGPRSVYGATKLLGERAVALAAPDRHTIVRTAWLFGTAGGCFPQTMLKLAEDRDTLSVVDDQVGCPTYTGHLAPALVELAGAGASGAGARVDATEPILGVLHLAGSGDCSWFAFASEIFRQAGVVVTVNPCTTDEFPRPAPRPAYSVLRSEHPGAPTLPDWRDGLADYLAARASQVPA